MSVYITTSRKPSILTKRLCKTLSVLIPRSVCENRGKKSVDGMFERVRFLGKRRVLLVYERHGNPYKISFIEVGARKWGWLEPELIISDLKFLGIPRELPQEIAVEGDDKAILESLFDFDAAEGYDRITLKKLENRISFLLKGKGVGLQFKVDFYGSKAKG